MGSFSEQAEQRKYYVSCTVCGHRFDIREGSCSTCRRELTADQIRDQLETRAERLDEQGEQQLADDIRRTILDLTEEHNDDRPDTPKPEPATPTPESEKENSSTGAAPPRQPDPGGSVHRHPTSNARRIRLFAQLMGYVSAISFGGTLIIVIIFFMLPIPNPDDILSRIRLLFVVYTVVQTGSCSAFLYKIYQERSGTLLFEEKSLLAAGYVIPPLLTSLLFLI